MIVLLSINLYSISLALGIIASVIGLMAPIHKLIKEKVKKIKEQTSNLEQLPLQIQKLSRDINNIKENNEKQNEDINTINTKIDSIVMQITDFERQEIIREVNNTFYSFPSLEDIPDDILQDTLDSCEIYLRSGYNHNTKPKCELLQEEYNRRLAKEAKHE